MEPAPAKAKVIDDPPPTSAKEAEVPAVPSTPMEPEPEPEVPQPKAPEPEPEVPQPKAPEPVAAAPEPTPAPAEEEDEEEDEEEEEAEHEPLVKWPENASIFIGDYQFGPTPAPPGPPKPGVPYKAILSGRAAYGTGHVLDGDRPLGPIMPYCPYCCRLTLLMLESGMEFVPILIDGSDKPKWFTDAYEVAKTPAFLGQPGGNGDEWTGEFENILGNLKASGNAHLLAMCEPGDVAVETIEKHASTAGFASALSFIAGTTTEGGKMLMMGLGGEAGLIEEGEPADEFRDRMVRTARDAFGELEKIFAELASSGKPFLGGDEPNQADVYALTMILFGHNIYLGGLTADPAAPCQLADVGAPSLMPYVERWMERPSYLKCYRTKSTVFAPAMRNFSNMLMMAHDVMDGGKRIYTCLERLRELDVEYDGKEHPPVIGEPSAEEPEPAEAPSAEEPKPAEAPSAEEPEPAEAPSAEEPKPAEDPTPAEEGEAAAKQEEEEDEEEEDDEPVVPWPEGLSPYVGGYLYGPEPGPGDRKPEAGKPFKAVLSARASYGGRNTAGELVDGDAALGPIMPFCPYCARISLLLIESGVEFQAFLIDAGDKPDWFINAYDKAETPAMMGSPGGLDDGQWVGESKDIIARACEQNEKFKELCEREGPITVEQIEKYANEVAFGMILGYIAPTEEESGKGLAMGLHKQAGLEPIEGETGAALRERCNAHFRAGLAEFEKMIGGLTTPFIGGDTPSKADVFAATTLFFSHNIAESGLCGDSVAMDKGASLADLGAPSVVPYLQRWMERPSWKTAYKTTCMYSTAVVACLAGWMMMAKDVFDDGRKLNLILDNLRRRDTDYNPDFVPPTKN